MDQKAYQGHNKASIHKRTNLTENVRANSIKGEEKSSNAYKRQIHKKDKAYKIQERALIHTEGKFDRE